jgi:hypothetical protein
MDSFYYARDHEGPCVWCVRGPEGFYLPLPDKTLALGVGKILSGYEEEGISIIKEFISFLEGGAAPGKESEIE